ncbi:MAG TPA: hypothetical protein VD689_02735 [Nitrosopumilaceae archaeon]|nr:hypothetical protein [Nitrosopumilaceae archaeon]
MRIILKDPTIILTALIGLIFTIGMLFLLTQLISETENIKKSWNEMTCQELESFLTSSEYDKLGKDDSKKFHSALEFCKEG